MPSTRSRGEPILSPDPELERTLCRMNRNLDILDDDHNPKIPPPIDAHDQLLPENHEEGEIHRQPPAPCPQEYYRDNINITDLDGPLFLQHLSQGHSFMVISSLMQVLTARGLFSGLPSEDPHAHIAKLSSMCKSCVGRPNLDMDVIGLRVFPITLTGEDAIWFNDFSYGRS